MRCLLGHVVPIGVRHLGATVVLRREGEARRTMSAWLVDFGGGLVVLV